MFADLHTFVGERNRPTGEVETFAAATVGPTWSGPSVTMASDDAAGLLLRFDGGARGRLHRVAGVRRAARTTCLGGRRRRGRAGVGVRATRSELWIGHRGRAERAAEKDPGADDPGRRGRRGVPGRSRRGVPGHVPRPVRRGVHRHRGRRRRLRPTYPTFADGHASSPCAKRSPSPARQWAPWTSRSTTTEREHPMKLGLLTAAFPDTPLDRGGRLGRCQRVRMPRGGVLAAGRRRDAALRRRVAHRLRPSRRGRGEGVGAATRRAGHHDLGARVLPEPAHPDRTIGRRPHRRPPAHGDRRRGADRRRRGQHLHRATTDKIVACRTAELRRDRGAPSCATPPTTASRSPSRTAR